jgi:hypothetical protein
MVHRPSRWSRRGTTRSTTKNIVRKSLISGSRTRFRDLMVEMESGMHPDVDSARSSDQVADSLPLILQRIENQENPAVKSREQQLQIPQRTKAFVVPARCRRLTRMGVERRPILVPAGNMHLPADTYWPTESRDQPRRCRETLCDILIDLAIREKEISEMRERRKFEWIKALVGLMHADTRLGCCIEC